MISSAETGGLRMGGDELLHLYNILGLFFSNKQLASEVRERVITWTMESLETKLS